MIKEKPKIVNNSRFQYYSDGVTKPTDPFYITECKCGHKGWNLLFVTRCSKCGSYDITCIPANMAPVQELFAKK